MLYVDARVPEAYCLAKDVCGLIENATGRLTEKSVRRIFCEDKLNTNYDLVYLVSAESECTLVQIWGRDQETLTLGLREIAAEFLK